MEKPKIRNELPKRKRAANYSRVKGRKYEQDIAIEIRNILKDEQCKTSRYASRLLDDCKVDLTCYFANIQTKAVVSNIHYNRLIGEIKASLERDFPERLALPVAVFHKKGRGQEFVVMTKSDFYDIMKIYKDYIDGDEKRIKYRV